MSFSLQKYIDEHPELKPELDRLHRWSDYYEKHPEECPHPGVLAPVDDSGEDLPGVCLACGKTDVTSEGETPDGEPPK